MSSVWEYMYGINTRYVFGGSRYEPRDTDCSGMVCACMYQCLGIEPDALGTWTGAQWASELSSVIWQGETPDLPWHIMKPDDIIFTSCESPLFDTGEGSHVGLYTGDENMPFLSHFCDGGPLITRVNGVYGGQECYFGVKRLKGDYMGVLEDTSYQEPFPTGADIGTRLVYIDKKTQEILDGVNGIPGAVFSYNWEDTAPGGNMYNCIVQTYQMMLDVWNRRESYDEKLDKLLATLDELEKRVEVLDKLTRDNA